MRPSIVGAVLVSALVLGAADRRVRAQDTPAPASPEVDVGTSVAVLRLRGVSTWQNFVWSMERPRLAHALSELERARGLTDDALGATERYVIAFAYLVLGDAERGTAAAAAFRAHAPGRVETRLLDGFEAILAGDGEAALSRLDEFVNAIETAPADVAFRAEFRFLAYLHRGAQRYDVGRHTAAVTDLGTAVRIARDEGRQPSHDLLLRLARAHQELSEFGPARDLVVGMLQRDPANAGLYHNLGLLEGTQKHYAEARTWYESALARRRDLPEAHGKLAFLAWEDAKMDPGAIPRMRAHLESYDAMVRREPSARVLADLESGFGAYWLALARQRGELRQRGLAAAAYERARRHLEKALELEPGCLRALNGIIQIGGDLDWPDERVAPYKQRLSDVLKQDRGAPSAARSSFC